MLVKAGAACFGEKPPDLETGITFMFYPRVHRVLCVTEVVSIIVATSGAVVFNPLFISDIVFIHTFTSFFFF